MAEENGVEDINGKTKEIAIENGDCDEDEKGTLILKSVNYILTQKICLFFRKKIVDRHNSSESTKQLPVVITYSACRHIQILHFVISMSLQTLGVTFR